jgi:outer membrane receptor protein involved in Fe transport
MDVIGTAGFRSANQTTSSGVNVAGHVIGNLSLGYEQKNWRVAGYIENLGNKEYFVNSNYVVAGRQVPVGIAGRPRQAGLRAVLNF